MELDSLHIEASRQLTICNSCRYCEGLCAVFPALERRTHLTSGDISQLANLCHDCRACYDACMYAPPHEFAINIPQVFSLARFEDYRRLVWPRRVPRFLSGRLGLFSGSLLAALLVTSIAAANVGISGLVHKSGASQSPYQLIPYPIMLILLAIPAIFAVVVMAEATRTYWHEVSHTLSGRIGIRAVARAGWYAATLRYLRGGGDRCYYPDIERPSGSRRYLHSLVACGFGLCAMSTVAAAFLQDVLSRRPPYPVFSVPVIAGILGGIAITVGCLGLLVLKRRMSTEAALAEMTVKDYGMLVALTMLSVTGLATFFTRDTAAFGVVFLVHLSTVMLAFAAAPYTKFVHVIYRFLAIVKDEVEYEQV